MVVDTVGGDVVQRSYSVLKLGGWLATVAEIAPDEAVARERERDLNVPGMMTRVKAERPAQTAALGKVVLQVA